jgi:hypothetical protein
MKPGLCLLRRDAGGQIVSGTFDLLLPIASAPQPAGADSIHLAIPVQ